jgi:adenylylsulfate kinase-like enzyme
MIYIITGKSNAGKTHTAKALKKDLENENRKVF